MRSYLMTQVFENLQHSDEMEHKIRWLAPHRPLHMSNLLFSESPPKLSARTWKSTIPKCQAITRHKPCEVLFLEGPFFSYGISAFQNLHQMSGLRLLQYIIRGILLQPKRSGASGLCYSNQGQANLLRDHGNAREAERLPTTSTSESQYEKTCLSATHSISPEAVRVAVSWTKSSQKRSFVRLLYFPNSQGISSSRSGGRQAVYGLETMLTQDFWRAVVENEDRSILNSVRRMKRKAARRRRRS